MNVGTIGTGEITSWFLTCWQELGNSCYAIHSRTRHKGETLRDKFHGVKVYTDLDLFMADQNIDVVYIASPNSLHFFHAKKALLSGKHVILEKPFTSTIEECDELIQLAEDKKLFLMEGITVVDLPNLQVISNLIKLIEPIHLCVANMSKVSSKYQELLDGKKPNVFQTKYSGGALMDLNVYNLHFITSLFGIPKEIQYVASLIEGIDIAGCATMKYEQFIAVCIASKNSNAQNFVELQGEHGIIHIPSASAMLSRVECITNDGVTSSFQKQNHTLTHIYYLRSFLSMIEHQDYKERDKRLQHTREVMALLVNARKRASIVFEADV